jgi:sodium/hydrogen antiporter
MNVTLWSLVIGVLMVTMALSVAYVRRLPLTPALLYLIAGVLLGPHVGGMIRLDPLEWSVLLEHLSEIAVVVSLFAAGLKLRSPFGDRRWIPPVRLAFLSMTVTVGLITAVGVWLLNLPLGVAVLLGAILAPTDPVLASEVQLESPFDRDRLRFSLTGEAGLNDGTAFPFVMLGLGLLGLHDIGVGGWRWFAVDLIWAVIGGLTIGAATGLAIGRLAIFLRRKHKETAGLEELLSLGLMSLAYGLALAAATYGFLAAFAAGVALRRIEVRDSRETASPAADEPSEAAEPAVEENIEPQDAHEQASHAPKTEPAYLAWAVLTFNEQLERLLEVATVLLVGGMLTAGYIPVKSLYFVPLLLLLIRPLSVFLGLAGVRMERRQRRYIAWFGIRGIGSIYYLMYAINQGLDASHASLLTGLVLATAAASIAVHGISVTPLMNAYGRRTATSSRPSTPH